MNCWKCGKQNPEPPFGKVSFRAVCEHCSAWLHCCKNCKYYKPGLPNDCMVSGTEFIRDRESGNFCEEFVLLGGDAKDRAISKKSSSFKNLFKDEV